MKIKSYIAGVALLLSITSCKNFLDVNNNPNAPINENLPLSTKIPAALVNTVNLEAGNINIMGSFWSGYLGTTSEGIGQFNLYKDYNGLVIRQQREGIKFWEESYINLEQYRLIIEQALRENQPFYVGASKIMQGLIFIRLVDLYNNIPFDDALKGTTKHNPRYENGKTVYQKAVDLITEGIQFLKNAPVLVNNSDIMFKGDATKWIKLGNTIKLRALLTQSETDNSTYIQAEIAKINAEASGFLDSDQSASIQPGYLNTSGKMNPFWENYYRNVQGIATGNYVDLRPTQFYIDQLSADDDPRLSSLFVQNNNSYKGVLFGNKNADNQYNRASTSAFKGPLENAGKPTGLFKALNQPLILLSDFESLFLQAEAAQRGWLTTNPLAALQDAIAASMKYMSIENAVRDLYFTRFALQFNSAPDKIKAIIGQKWRSLFFISGMQTWNDYRRLGIPEIPNSLSAAAPENRPLRLMYPESEIGTNLTQVQAQGDDNITAARIWWDVK